MMERKSHRDHSGMGLERRGSGDLMSGFAIGWVGGWLAGRAGACSGVAHGWGGCYFRATVHSR